MAQLGIATLTSLPTAPASFDIVIKCTGTGADFTLARTTVRPRGTMVLRSTYRGTVAVVLSAIVVDEVRLLGSRCGPFAKALALLTAGTLDLNAIKLALTRCFNL